MNYNLGVSEVPQISLWDGVVMGGGVGVSIFGEFRVATERTMFAMPETAIGLFPDVGSSAWLPHLGNGLGEYIALTGTRLHAYDLCTIGLATHYLPSASLHSFEEGLVSNTGGGAGEIDGVSTRAAVEGLLATVGGGDVPDPSVSVFGADEARGRARVAACFFDKHSVEDIITALEGLATVAPSPEDGAWAEATLNQLNGASPTSLKLTLAQIQRGRTLDLKGCLEMEFRLVQGCMRGGDFTEGVRAMLVDKDRSPRWVPSTLDAVDSTLVEAHFAPLVRELVLEPCDTGLMGGGRRVVMARL
uniref:3-hydroxyisobutyryl-CoA hydrolase n=1 Tax=Octactis speculum TaxID=3111310 RepID=A0A7S2D716_9STRA